MNKVSCIKNVPILLLSFILLLSACQGPGADNNSGKTAKGNAKYGGVLKINENEGYQTLYPYLITDIVSVYLATQIYEGLVRFDNKSLEIEPNLAESWTVDSSGLFYTFRLKQGVKFHDDECFEGGEGREVTAKDFKFSFEQLCTKGPYNLNFNSTFRDRVIGANDFYDGKTDKLEGVRVVDDYTLQIELSNPSSSFIFILATLPTYVIPHEALEKYSTLMRIGTGPFQFAREDGGLSKKITLVKNEEYHGTDTLGNQLPFLDSVIFSFLPTGKEALKQFKAGAIDMVSGLPSEAIREMVESNPEDFTTAPVKYVLHSTPEMATHYYEFNLTKTPFNNAKVRKAFNYAIDRDKIIEQVLKGEAYGPGIHGITPPSFPGYDITGISGYSFKPEKAKKLLAEAGYPDGKNFPTIKIELNSGGSKNDNVVVEVQKQLKEVLNVNVDFEVVTMGKKLEDAKYANAEIFRSAWIADFPSPENFLWILYGANVPEELNMPSYPNTPRYVNPDYDKLFELGKRAKTKKESYAYFKQAEQIMIEDAPIMVLWYDDSYRFVSAKIKQLHINPMRYLDLSQVYLDGSALEKKEVK